MYFLPSQVLSVLMAVSLMDAGQLETASVAAALREDPDEAYEEDVVATREVLGAD